MNTKPRATRSRVPSKSHNVWVNKVGAFLGAAMLMLAWGTVPSLAHPHGYKVFTGANCVGIAANRPTFAAVLASKPPFNYFMILGESTQCYQIP